KAIHRFSWKSNQFSRAKRSGSGGNFLRRKNLCLQNAIDFLSDLLFLIYQGPPESSASDRPCHAWFEFGHPRLSGGTSLECAALAYTPSHQRGPHQVPNVLVIQ